MVQVNLTPATVITKKQARSFGWRVIKSTLNDSESMESKRKNYRLLKDELGELAKPIAAQLPSKLKDEEIRAAVENIDLLLGRYGDQRPSVHIGNYCVEAGIIAEHESGPHRVLVMPGIVHLWFVLSKTANAIETAIRGVLANAVPAKQD